MKKAIILLSGGMDSTTALYWAVNEGLDVVLCIAFDYGSKHNKEEHRHAKATCDKINIRFEKVNLDFSLFESDLLKKGGDIPEGHYADKSMKATVVPFRNGIMLSYSAGIAESVDADCVILGNHFGDHAVYPDCRKDFIEPMKQAIRHGTYKQIELISPFCGISKTDIAKIGDELGIDWNLTYSCYKGNDKHCGKCGTCVERIEAFTESGINDPTEYES